MWGEGRGGGAWQSIRGGKTRRRRRRGAAKLGWGVKERGGGCKKKGKRCKERAQGSLCVLVAEESKWDQGGGGEGFRGAEEESILLNSHASWRRRGTRRRGRARA